MSRTKVEFHRRLEWRNAKIRLICWAFLVDLILAAIYPRTFVAEDGLIVHLTPKINDSGATTVPNDSDRELTEELADWPGVCNGECDVESADHVYCYGCEGFRHGLCPAHPVAFAPNLPIEGGAESTVPSYFTLKQSTIPNAGLGIFTNIYLEAGMAYGPYLGELMEADDKRMNHNYTWTLIPRTGQKKMAIDASDLKISNYLRWMNCARYKEEQNLISMHYKENIFYVTYRPVQPGEELLVWYGIEYARSLGVENIKHATSIYAPPLQNEKD